MAEVIWDKEIDVPMKWIEFVDDNVLTSELLILSLDSLMVLMKSRRTS